MSRNSSHLTPKASAISAIGLALCLVSTDVGATSDTGRRAYLLGVAGPRALVVEIPTQVGCEEMPCRAHAIDLSEKDHPRGFERLIAAGTLEAYLAALGTEQQSFDRVVPTGELRALEIRGRDGGVAITTREGTLSLELVHAASADAMAAFEKGSGRPCLDSVSGPLCSDCQETKRFLHGREAIFHACAKGPAAWRDDPLRPADCDCHAEAPIVHPSLGGGHGTLILAAPHQLAQNVAGGTRAGETTDLVLRPEALEAYETPAGQVVVAGAAIHAPDENATYFPLVAATSVSADKHHEEDEPPPAGPPRARGAACRGCTLPAPTNAPSPWLILAALVFLRRRAR